MADRPAERHPNHHRIDRTKLLASAGMPSRVAPQWAKPALGKAQGIVRSLALAVLALLAVGLAAAAADFTLGSSEGIWTNADASVSGLNTSSISWGTSTGYGTSGFEFDGVTNESFNAGETFLIGTFTHHNKPVYGDTPTKLTLEITLDFDTPAVSPDPSFTYVLDFDETPNGCDDDDDDPMDCCPSWQDSDTPCDDRIIFPSGSPTDTFWVGDTKYALEILGFTSSPYGGSGISQFVTEERKDNVAYVVGRLTVVCSLASIHTQPLSQSAYETSTVLLSVDASGDSLFYQWSKDGVEIPGATNDTLTLTDLAASDEGNYTVEISNACGSVSSETAVLTVLAPDCANYDVDFVSSSYNGSNTTFTYRVTSNAAPAVSHWVLGMGNCITASDIVSAGPGNWDFGTDPTTGVYGLKFDSGVEIGTTTTFTVTLEGYWPEASTAVESAIKAATKSGGKVCVYSTIGPSCNVADLELTKTVDDASPRIGDTVTYTITLSNQGPAAATSVEVEDQLPTGVSHVSHLASKGSYDEVSGLWQVGTVSVGGTETLSITGTVLESGGTTNTAEVTQSPVPDPDSTPNNGVSSEDDQDSVSITPTAQPALALQKTGPASVNIGGSVDYVLTVTNTGNVTLHNVTVSDPMLGLNTTIGSLAVGASETITASYGPVDEGDFPTLENTATADSDETGPVSDPHTVSVVSHPSLSIDKIGSETVAIGSTIDYTITITNTGDITLHNIAVVDAKIGLNESIASLAVGASEILSGSYGPVTESDLPSVVNTATADSDTTDPVDDDHTTTVLTDPGLSIEKSGPASASIGDTVEYTITVTNTGDVTLHNVVILDPTLSLSLIVDHLGVGEEVVLTPSYGPVTEDDVPAIVNTATAEADEVGPVSDTHTLTVLTHPNLLIEKTGPETAGIGDSVEYTITVTNTGDITLHNVTVTDAKLGIDHSIATMAAGEAITLQETYGPVTEGDLPSILNTASATADETGPVSDDHTVSIETNPAMILAKSGPASADIGDTVTYEIVITNTGDVTLHNVSVTDAKLGIFDQSIGTLSVGASEILRPTYGPIDEDDLPEIANTATAVSDETDPVSDSHTITVVTHPALMLKKTGDSTANIGETIDYTITVTNTGDVTLHHVSVVDPMLGLSESIAELAPGASESFTGTYGPVTESDLPSVTNLATADSDETETEEASHTTVITPHPSLSIDKTGPTTASIGDTIDYTIIVTNTGDVTLHNVAIVDALLSLAENIPVLAPGANETIHESYGPVTEEDVPSVFNTAVAASDEVSPVSDTHTVTVPTHPALTIDKSGPTTASIGETIQYTITITNSGDVTLHNVTVTDTKLGISKTFASLAPGGDETVYGSYGPITEVDVPSVLNTATADADEVNPISDNHTVQVVTHPSLAIEKTGPTTANIGDTIPYTITVTNTGDVTLHNVLVTDSKLGLSETFASLAPGEDETVSASYGPITEEDVPSIFNSATATSDEVSPVFDTHTVPVPTHPALAIDKSGPDTATIGDTVDYTITVTNTGDVTLHNVVVSDAKLGLSETFASLAPGADETVHGSYGPVTEEDVPSVLNTASADSDETGPVSDGHTVSIPTHPALAIDKSGPDTATIGDTVDYTITVTNTGDVTLHNVSIVDVLLGLDESLDSLVPGASETISGTYGPITEEDVPSVPNTATANSDETEPVSDDHTVSISTHPALAIDKSGPNTANIGDTIDYTITVTNTGDVSLHNVVVTDAKLGISETVASLAPGADATVHGTHGPVTEEDVPSVLNTATADSDETEPVSDDHTVSIPTHPALAIDKSGPDTANIGDTIEYTITVTNTGDVTLHNVSIVDALLGLDESLDSLVPGASETISGTYGPITEGDVPSVLNTATADSDETEPVSDDHTVSISTRPALAIEKTGPATADIADEIDYTITVTNAGDVTLHNVRVVDEMLGIDETFATLAPGASIPLSDVYGPITEQDLPSLLNTASAEADETGPVTDDHTVTIATHPALVLDKTGTQGPIGIGGIVNYTLTVSNVGDITLHNVRVVDAMLGIDETFASLAPGASVPVSGTYGPIGEQDLPGPIVNTATADSDETEPVSDSHSVGIESFPGLAIEKTGDASTSIGETVSYTITVSNVGDVTLHNVRLIDEMLGINQLFAALAPGQSEIVSGSYGPVVEDDAPAIENTATADSDETEPVSDSHTVPVATNPGLGIVKTGDPSTGIGETVDYTLTVTNIGDTTLHNVVVTDAKLGISETFASLAPDQSEIVSGSYGPVAEGDAPAIENTATADSDETEPVSDSHTVPVTTNPGLGIVKTGDASTGIGETVNYTITVTNIGDITLHNVHVVDAMLGIDETVVNLAPGASIPVSGTYGPVTEDDLPILENTASADSDETEPVSDSHSVPVNANPGLAIEKTGDASTGIGETVNYTITVTNIGDVTLHNVVVNDAKLGISESVDSLAPGASIPVSGTYGPVSEDDLPVIENTATADSDETEPVSDSHSVPVNANPGLTIEKTGPASTTIGGTVDYTITVTNIGDVTLHNVVVTDAKLGISETFATLAPGASIPISGTYGPVSEEDLPVIENTATADSSETEPVSNSHDVLVNTNPGLGIEKTGPSFTTIGEPVDYTITVTNIGDVTLHNVVVTDAKLGISETFATLAPGASIPVSGTYGPVTEDDVPVIDNTATADSNETEPVSDSHSVLVNTSPGLAIEKTGDQGPARIGETVDYTLTITNVGDVTLHQVTVTDPMLGIDDTFATLAPGAQITLSGTYGPITEQDTPGPIVNTATADSEETEPVTDTHSIGIESFPALALDKTGDSSTAIGATVNYTLTVTNIGDITLHNVVVSDAKLGIFETFASLAPGASEAIAGSYGPVLEDDIPVIENTATADSDETEPVSDSHSVPVNTNPGLAIEKTGDLFAAIGQTVDYTITVSNTGDVTLHNVRVVDAMLAIDETFVSLAPGASRAVSGSYGPLTEEDIPLLENTATADSDETEPVSDSHSVPVTASPGLSIVKSGPATATVGDSIDYTITVTNTGDVTLNNVVVTDAKLGLSETFASLAPGATRTVLGTYGPVLEEDAPTVVNTASASSDETEPVVDAHTVQIAPALIDLSLTKTVSNETPAPGEIVVFTIRLANAPDAAHATGVEVTDRLPSGYSFLASNPSQGGYNSATGLWTVGNLNAGNSASLELTAIVQPNGEYTSPAEVTDADQEDRDSTPANADAVSEDDDDAVVVAIRLADLSVTKTVDIEEPGIGDTIEFTITVTNLGPSEATGVTVADALPFGLDYVSDSGFGDYSPITDLWQIGTIANGASVSLTIEARVEANAGSTLVNTAEIATSDLPDPDPTNNRDSAAVDVIAADLRVSKTVNNPTPTVGEEIVFTIQVTNQGPNTATNVRLTDLLPDGLTYVSDDAPGTYLPSTGLWTIALLPVGMTDTLRITAVPDEGTAGTTLTNLAEVTATQVDPNPSDNSDTADVDVQDVVGGGGGGQDACTGKVIINEVAWAGTSANADDEWIELRNIGGEPVDLTGWTLRWRKKEPVEPEDFEWHAVPLSGVLEGAHLSACELAEQDPTPSVDFEKREVDDISWRVVSRPIDLDLSYLTVERRTDKTVSTNDADVVYDTVEPYIMELHNEGEIIELLNADGIVVDSANAFPMPSPAWPAGDAATFATMERTDPLGPDTPDNWHTNLGITTWGRDALGEPLVATADTVNSRPLEEMEIFADLTPTKTLAGARLEVALELSRQERRETGWPWIRVTRPIPAGGGGESLVPASYSFASRYSNDLYWLGIDTAGLPAGDYLVWVVYGDGETVLVPITILP